MDLTLSQESPQGEPTITGQLVRQAWVKPALERLTLKDARTGCGLASDVDATCNS